MIRTALGALVAAFLMFVWGFLFWGLNVAGDPFQRFERVEQEAAVSAALKAQVPGPGTYSIPYAMVGENAQDAEAIERFTARHKAGPIAWVVYQPQGCDPMGGMKMPLGFLHMLVVALLLGGMLWVTQQPCWKRRLATGLLAAAALTLWSNLRQPLWFHAPFAHHLTVAVYDLVAWSIAALVLVRFTAPESAAEAG